MNGKSDSTSWWFGCLNCVPMSISNNQRCTLKMKSEVLARADWSVGSRRLNVECNLKCGRAPKFHNYSKFPNVPEHSITFWIYLIFIVPLVFDICSTCFYCLVYLSFHSETECLFLVGEHVTLFLTPFFCFFFCMSLVNLSNVCTYSFLFYYLWLSPYSLFVYVSRNWFRLETIRTLHSLA